MFDTTIQVLRPDVAVADDGSHLQLVFVTGIPLPVGPDQYMPIQTGVYRVPMTKKAAKEIWETLGDAIEQLEDEKPESGIVVASSLQGVDQAASLDSKLRG
jgi:hypothetical protein